MQHLNKNIPFPLFQWISLVASVLTWPLISFGAIVRLHGAGLACPDWPLCYGQLVPPPGLEIALEVGHRFIATILGMAIIGLVMLSYRMEKYRTYRKMCLLALFLVIIQGILGGLTVTMRLWPPVVSMHLIGGNLLFALLVYITWLSFKQHHCEVTGQSLPTARPFTSLSRNAQWMLVLFFVIIGSGGVNSTTYSGYACEAFPGCHHGSEFSFSMSYQTYKDQVFPGPPTELEGQFMPETNNEWVHMLHRLLAIAGGLAIMIQSFLLFRKYRNKSVRGAMLGIALLIPLEIMVGAMNAVFRVPVPISALHTGIAATVIGLLSFCLVKGIHDPLD
ncbi:MAG: COX15/CtaA family protein [SAR324 cluster bacterium]|nr:COX15/CtaA family protein [SAR324 cluster bacterium]